MKCYPRPLLLAFCLLLPLAGCKPKPGTGDEHPAVPANVDADPAFKALVDYRSATRTAYNNRRFDELEQNADDARATKARFGNGSWKIWQFYDALGCADTEPESMWQLHASIHKAWIAAKPDSITAHVAQVIFLFDYAWHARGTGYAGTVSPAGWQLFGERLKAAHQALIDCKEQGKNCPVWWSAGLRIALGEQWPRVEFDRFYARAKAFEPTFWNYDTIRSRFLSLKWYGQSGEWEAVADEAAADPKGLGMEMYARCVLEQIGNYHNVFQETQAKWAKAQAGLELMEQRYPESLEVARAYCRLACLAGDRATAKRLFDRLGNNASSDIWVTQEYLQRARAWANAAN